MSKKKRDGGGRRCPGPGRMFEDVVADRLSRRTVLKGAAAAGGVSMISFLGGTALLQKAQAQPLLGFTEVPISTADDVIVPDGYTWHVVNAWGDPIVAGGPEFLQDASQSADDQALQSGMHHDGMAFFPLPKGSDSVDHGLLAINFEYIDEGLLFPDGFASWSAEKVRKAQNAHGLGVMEIEFDGQNWSVIPDSPFGRRITASTPFKVKGPAAGNPLMRTAFDPTGREVLGTFNNCAHGVTPWGTYLSCEENVTPYFISPSGDVSRLLARYGVDDLSWGFRWHEFDERFNADLHPNEPNRHGWVVEFDPYDPTSTPVKHTAMGRMAHENAALAIAPDNRVVYYMGDDDFRTRFEHIFKFVSDRPFVPGGKYEANQNVLDHGRLYAAVFHADGTGEWIELTHRNKDLKAFGFKTQGDVVIDARTAADIVGATYMDRPEWIAVHPHTKEVYCCLSNNSSRGVRPPFGEDEILGADAANPRAPNPMGHIIRWREEDNNPASLRFEWDIYVLAGDPAHPDPLKQASVPVAFAQPDGITIDGRGVVWICTDSSAASMATADWTGIGNNQVLAGDPVTGEIQRFLTAVPGCELTGAFVMPDLTTMLVNIQHPGERPLSHPPRSDPLNPKMVSSWPDGDDGGRPRAATIAVRRIDGGIIGT